MLCYYCDKKLQFPCIICQNCDKRCCITHSKFIVCKFTIIRVCMLCCEKIDLHLYCNKIIPFFVFKYKMTKFVGDFVNLKKIVFIL